MESTVYYDKRRKLGICVKYMGDTIFMHVHYGWNCAEKDNVKRKAYYRASTVWFGSAHVTRLPAGLHCTYRGRRRVNEVRYFSPLGRLQTGQTVRRSVSCEPSWWCLYISWGSLPPLGVPRTAFPKLSTSNLQWTRLMQWTHPFDGRGTLNIKVPTITEYITSYNPDNCKRLS